MEEVQARLGVSLVNFWYINIGPQTPFASGPSLANSSSSTTAKPPSACLTT